MGTNQKSPAKPNWKLLAWLIGAVVLVLFCVMVVYPLLLAITDNNGVFTLTFSLADLDLDGDLDVLVHNRRNPGEFEVFAGGTIWTNQGGLQGGQTGQLTYHRSDIQGGLASTLADLDGDSDSDLLVYDGNRLILGLNQDGTFRQANTVAVPVEQREMYGPASQYAALVTGDIDNDGRVDALVLGCCGRAFKVRDEAPDIPNFSWAWLNLPDAQGRLTGKSASLDALAGFPVGEAALADLDGDGDLDLFAAILEAAQGTSPGSGGAIFLNDGRGHFNDSGQRFPARNSTSLALADLDGDGDPDALLGNGHGADVLLNQAGTFSASDSTLTGDRTRSVILGDMDGDGDPDALLVGQRRATLWWNDGQGQFTRAAQSFRCSARQNLTVGDFNGDGWLDIFIAEYDKTARMWLNTGNGGFR